ncbi:MAG: DUF5050 domain-containing protein, partial [Clostridiales bacterium]|nr:DUF5050 domain-containing protein [Clostridiales bacterium]
SIQVNPRNCKSEVITYCLICNCNVNLILASSDQFYDGAESTEEEIDTGNEENDPASYVEISIYNEREIDGKTYSVVSNGKEDAACAYTVYVRDESGETTPLIYCQGYGILTNGEYLYYSVGEYESSTINYYLYSRISIYRYNIASRESQLIYSQEGSTGLYLPFACIDNYLYAGSETQYGGEYGTFLSINLSTGEAVRVVKEADSIQQLPGSDKLLVSATGFPHGGPLYLISPDGKEVVLITEEAVCEVEVENDFIYFTETTMTWETKRGKCNLDGSQVQYLTDVSYPELGHTAEGEAYRTFMSEDNYPQYFYQSETTEFSVYDINNDGVQELILREGPITGYYYVYGYVNAEVTLLGTCEYSNRYGAYYSAARNAFVIISNGGADFLTYEFYQVNNKLNLMFQISHSFFGPGLGTVTEDNPQGYEIYSFSYYDADGVESDIKEADWNAYIDDFEEITFTEFEAAVSDDITVTENTAATFEEKIEDIRTVYYSIQDNLNIFEYSADENGIGYYRRSGILRKVVIPAGTYD